MLGTLMYGMLYVFIHSMRRIGWWRLHIEGLENLPPRQMSGMIVAMNHVHWLDIPIIGALLPFRYRLSWLGKSEIFKNPVVAWWLRQMQVIPINRGKRDLAALETSVAALKSGAALLIYPEGHRSRDGKLQQGRGGAVRIAMQAGVPIIPIAIQGTEHGFKGLLSGKPVRACIGKPYLVVPTPDGKLPPDTMDQLTTDLMMRIAGMLPEEQRGVYRAMLADGAMQQGLRAPDEPLR